VEYALGARHTRPNAAQFIQAFEITEIQKMGAILTTALRLPLPDNFKVTLTAFL